MTEIAKVASTVHGSGGVGAVDACVLEEDEAATAAAASASATSSTALLASDKNSNSNDTFTTSPESDDDEPQVVDVPLSTKHSLFWTGESVTGHQFYHVKGTLTLAQHWTYVIRHTLSLGAESKLHEGPSLIGPPSHLSSIITSKQWSELWSPTRMQSIQKDLVQAEQANLQCWNTSCYLMFAALLANVMLKSWQRPQAGAAAWIVVCVTIAILFRWSYVRRMWHRYRAWQSFSNVCNNMNTMWLSLHQHGWTAECHYEKWTFSRGPLQGFRLYFLPIQPRPATSSSSRSGSPHDENGQSSATGIDDAIRARQLPSVLCSTLNQNGHVRILLSTVSSNKSSGPASVMTRWIQWTPLLVTEQGDSRRCDNNAPLPIARTNTICATNSTNDDKTIPLVTNEATESPVFTVADIDRLWKTNDSTTNEFTSQHVRAGDDTGSNDAWFRFWVDWQLAAKRYNGAHRLTLVVTILLVAHTVSLLVVVSVMGPLFGTKKRAALASLFVAAAVWCWVIHRKAVAFDNLHTMVQQHCFDFIDANVFLEFRTVATFDQDSRRHRQCGSDGPVGYCVSMFGRGAGPCMEFTHYLYLYRIPPKVSSPRLEHRKTST